ncbi:MAG TPA: hypothetical protein VF245_06890 [Solirubrobacterales bacterium]
MGLLDAPVPSATPVGNDAGWLLSFHREEEENGCYAIVEKAELELGRDDYDGKIAAALVDGLAGGSFSFTVEGITDEGYAKIAQVGKDHPTVVKLYLYWRDTTSSAGAYLRSIVGFDDGTTASHVPGGPVAVLAIDSVTRTAGERRYQAEIVAREWVYARLEGSRLCRKGMVAKSPADAVSRLTDAVHGHSHWHEPTAHSEYPPAPPKTKGNGKIVLSRGESAAKQLERVAGQLELRSGRFGRGMLLIRQGELHAGMRPVPLQGKGKPLTPAGGLLEPRVTGKLEIDPTRDPCLGQAPTRRRLEILLKGRPDLFPGDVVELNLPPEDLAHAEGGWSGAIGDLLGGPPLPAPSGELTEPRTRVYVNGVEHRLGADSGFVTKLTGVELEKGVEVWDWRESPGELGGREGERDGHPNPETDAGRAVMGRIERALAATSAIEVGEVRQTTSAGEDGSPAQTELVWEGLEPPDGEPMQARRLGVARPSPAPLGGVPYATPWAWGRCGLVLPRYPGTRVVTAHRRGQHEDAIDIGAIWESGRGPDSEPGDWWLILPVGVSRDSALAEDEVAEEPSGPAVNDLTDGDGNRVIEVGELTLRVGADSLGDAGERPERASEQGSITIEHADGGASIVIGSDGGVRIHAAKGLRLEAEQDIELDAANVKVTVDGTMDVS